MRVVKSTSLQRPLSPLCETEKTAKSANGYSCAVQKQSHSEHRNTPTLPLSAVVRSTPQEPPTATHHTTTHWTDGCRKAGGTSSKVLMTPTGLNTDPTATIYARATAVLQTLQAATAADIGDRLLHRRYGITSVRMAVVS